MSQKIERESGLVEPAALRNHGCANVKIEVIKDSVHYVADEEPVDVAQFIGRYASFDDDGQRAMRKHARNLKDAPMWSHMVFLNQKSQSAKQKKACAMKRIITSIGLCMLIAGMLISAAAKGPKADGPTAKNLMAAEEALAKAFRENNADGIQS